MYQSIIDNDSHGYYCYLAECDTDALGGIMGEEHITRHFRRKKAADDRIRSIAHALDWAVPWERTEDRT